MRLQPHITSIGSRAQVAYALLLAFIWTIFPILATAANFPNNKNTTFYNPILPGFHPDPSCIFVPQWDDTFFCATSSFNSFPGIPIHASKDLVTWKLIGHALNRPEQLPVLATSNGSTSGIWAPTLRYHKGVFWVVTTMVHDKRPDDDPSRWDNIIFKSRNPYQTSSWSNAVHFNFTGYDPSPYWHKNGKVYMTGAHAWKVGPWIQMTTIDLDTGKLGGEWRTIWNGTGGMAPEGPHIYQKDGWYYLLAAEGGTGLGHMVTIARSRDIEGPYESNPENPILTNANTTEYFQTVGHADLFQDKNGKWWAVALSTRSGPDYLTYPMGRETVLTPVTWDQDRWPIISPIRGTMSGWKLPLPSSKPHLPIPGPKQSIIESDNIKFPPGSTLPSHFVHWRFPDPNSYHISPPNHPNTLALTPSKLNLTAIDGNSASEPQTFIARRQMHTLFTFSVKLSFTPRNLQEEAGVTVFLTQNHHIRMGAILLPPPPHQTTSPTSPSPLPQPQQPLPYLTFYCISYTPVPASTLTPVPPAWFNSQNPHALTLHLEIQSFNQTHYSFSAAPLLGLRDKPKQSEMITIGIVPASIVSWGFTGCLVGVYATRNGYGSHGVGESSSKAYFSDWRYAPLGEGEGQIRELE